MFRVMKHFVSRYETLRSAPMKHFVSRYETLCFAGMKQSVSGQESEDETRLPDVSLCVFVEYGIFSDAVSEKCFPDVLLLSRFHIGLVAVDAVVFGSSEVAQDFGLDDFGLFLWQRVEQVLHAPSQADLAGRLEVGTGLWRGRDGLRVDGGEESPVAIILLGSQLAQAFSRFRALRVETAGVIGWRCQRLCGIFHCLSFWLVHFVAKLRSFSEKSRTFAFAKYEIRRTDV